MENVFIFIVFRVFTANTNMERRPGDWSVHETRGKRELVFRNYWSQYGHNNATQLSAWPMGSTNHLSSLKSTIIDWKELISDLIEGTENIRYWATTEQDLRAESRLAKLQFCAKFCANCHSANFSAVGRRTRPQSAGYTGRGEIVISTLGLRLRNEWTEEKRRVLNSQSVSAGSGPAGEDCGPGRPSGQTLLIPASDTRWRSPPGPPDTNHCNIIMSTLWQLTLITSFKLFHQISLSQHHSDASCDDDDDTDHYHDDDDPCYLTRSARLFHFHWWGALLIVRALPGSCWP